MQNKNLHICEIFHSIQGESTLAGLPCVFVRLSGCPLNCRWCDTKYASQESEPMSIADIMLRVENFECPLVEVTGGEPLAQAASLDLLDALVDEGYEVMLETCGSIDIGPVNKNVRRIVDVKCPSSGESDKNLYANLEKLSRRDEVKFVIADRDDFAFALDVIENYNLMQRCPVLIAPVQDSLELATLAEWLLEVGLPLRLQPQMHKQIWGPEKRGV